MQDTKFSSVTWPRLESASNHESDDLCFTKQHRKGLWQQWVVTSLGLKPLDMMTSVESNKQQTEACWLGVSVRLKMSRWVLDGLRSSFILVILVFPWFFLWWQHEVDVCGFEWNDSITPGYIAMKNIVCLRWIIILWWSPDFLVLSILLFGWWPNSYKVTPTPTILSCS